MIKFLGERDGKELYGFGLSRANCEKLLEGKPIFIDLDVMGMNKPMPDNRGVVLIFAGETEQAMVDLLRDAGRLSPDVLLRPEEGLDEPNSSEISI